jgi:hypothetical protein
VAVAVAAVVGGRGVVGANAGARLVSARPFSCPGLLFHGRRRVQVAVAVGVPVRALVPLGGADASARSRSEPRRGVRVLALFRGAVELLAAVVAAGRHHLPRLLVASRRSAHVGERRRADPGSGPWLVFDVGRVVKLAAAAVR